MTDYDYDLPDCTVRACRRQDVLPNGLCPACYKAWQRTKDANGRQDRSVFEARHVPMGRGKRPPDDYEHWEPESGGTEGVDWYLCPECGYRIAVGVHPMSKLNGKPHHKPRCYNTAWQRQKRQAARSA